MDESKAPDIEEFKKPKPHVLDGLPAYLQDPKNYKKVSLAIYDSMKGACTTHSEVVEAAACAKCQRAFLNRGEMMRKLGFQSPAQYLAWKKTHEFMRTEMRLPYYNSK